MIQYTDPFEILISASAPSVEERPKHDNSKGCTMMHYSPKSVAVFGKTQAIKEELKAMGGKFNARLTYQGEKLAGWIFHISRERQLAHYFGLD